MASVVLLSIAPAVTLAGMLSQTTVKMGTDATGDQIQFTSISIDRILVARISSACRD